MRFTCPRRISIESTAKDSDEWIDACVASECSFCGSISGLDCLALIESNVVYPVNRYKIKIANKRVYLLHLSELEQEMFVSLYNNGIMVVDKGDFSIETRPYFMVCSRG